MNSSRKHPEPERVREARAHAHRPDDGEAFLPDSAEEPNSLIQTDGEPFAEEFIASALAGEPAEPEANDEVIEEEWGGPFLELEADDGDVDRAIPEPPAAHKLPPRLH
jgi:hypothetical protein